MRVLKISISFLCSLHVLDSLLFKGVNLLVSKVSPVTKCGWMSLSGRGEVILGLITFWERGDDT